MYGPSVPTLLGKEKSTLETYSDNLKQILTVDFNGIKTMSMGYS
jgi:hypothetical protein